VVKNVDYYWFVGYDGVTASHLGRNVIDITDRLLHGYNQRWAFVMVAATVTDNIKRDGLDERATDEMLRDFIGELVPMIHRETVRL
jgi:hypothetical protein